MSHDGRGLEESLTDVETRLARLDWAEIEAHLGRQGFARTPAVLGERECAALIDAYDDDTLFRSRVEMARHGFGRGEYKYFAAPLPDLVEALRRRLFARLAPIASRWMEALGSPERFQPDLPAFLARCAASGQSRPTPLLLRYGAGDYNCLHQDVYGPVAFPLQVVALLSRPGVDFTGGELLFVEQRPRAQSVGAAVVPALGEMLVFTNRYRPVRGTRGYFRANVRHGLSRVHSGAPRAGRDLPRRTVTADNIALGGDDLTTPDAHRLASPSSGRPGAPTLPCTSHHTHNSPERYEDQPECPAAWPAS